MSNLNKFAVGIIVTKRQGIGYLHAGIVGKVVRHLDEGDIIEVDWQDPSLDEPCVRQYRTGTIHKYVTVFIPEKKMIKTSINILTGSTKYKWDEIGAGAGFFIRATGRTTAIAMELLARAMRSPSTPISYFGEDHYKEHPYRTADLLAKEMGYIIRKMEYKGFVFHTGNKTVTFNPFAEVEIEV